MFCFTLIFRAIIHPRLTPQVHKDASHSPSAERCSVVWLCHGLLSLLLVHIGIVSRCLIVRKKATGINLLQTLFVFLLMNLQNKSSQVEMLGERINPHTVSQTKKCQMFPPRRLLFFFFFFFFYQPAVYENAHFRVLPAENGAALLDLRQTDRREIVYRFIFISFSFVISKAKPLFIYCGPFALPFCPISGFPPPPHPHRPPHAPPRLPSRCTDPTPPQHRPVI